MNPDQFLEDACVARSPSSGASLPRDQRRATALENRRAGNRPSSEPHSEVFADGGGLVKIGERVLFTAGLAATAWDEQGRPISYSEWSEDDLRRMAENDRHIRQTGQPIPYLVPAHFEDPVEGYPGPLRFEPSVPPSVVHPKGKPARLIADVWAEEWIAEQVKAGRRPWRSAEVTRHAEAADFHGITGPVFRGLALLNRHPRRKNLDSPVYAEQGIESFEEPASAGSVYVTTFREQHMPNMEQILAALNELGGDTDKLAAVAAALGLGGGDGDGAAAPAPVVAQEPVTPDETEPVSQVNGDEPAIPPRQEEQMSEPVIKALQAENAALKARVDAHDRKRQADIQRVRASQLATFAEELTDGYGAGRAAKGIELAESLLATAPADEVFSEDGTSHLDAIKAKVLDVMGEPVVRALRTPGASGRSRKGVSENFGEARVETYQELTSAEQVVMKNPAFRGALDLMTKRRMHVAGRG